MSQPQPSPISAPQAPVANNQAQNIQLNQNQPQQAPQEQLDPNNEIVQGLQHKEQAIQELIGMGFGRPEIEQALTCAYYNKERAIDYLINVW